jgi:DNA-binding NarL/FixJ family response regulator
MGAPEPLRLLVAGNDDRYWDDLCRTIPPATVEIVGRARSAPEARALTADLRPDVVLLDLEAPSIGGPEAIGQVKRHPGAPIIVVLTSEDTPGARTASFAAGADGFVAKARSTEKLRALISKIRPSL